ncbi:hypothetical protein [Flavobacterium sp.]|uniref:hypothetical protein n=1 Tax=Flavobacterium sp. TaxID=239 RepID=UPI003D0EEE0C
MEIILNVILSVLTGLISSYLFLKYYLKRKRPVISISKYISKVNINGESNYFFKFVNNTDVEIFDVHIELTFYKPFGDFAGRNLQGKDIQLKDNFISYIPFAKDNDLHNLHAMRIRTTEDLEQNWEDESSFIRLTIIAKHSLSGFNKVFVHDYLTKDCITEKKFLSGDELNVN